MKKPPLFGWLFHATAAEPRDQPMSPSIMAPSARSANVHTSQTQSDAVRSTYAQQRAMRDTILVCATAHCIDFLAATRMLTRNPIYSWISVLGAQRRD